MRRTIGSARGDARGEAPCMKITLISPFPGGEGGWGMGERKQAKGKVSRRPTGQATLWAPPTPAAPGDLPDKPPIGHLQRRFNPCRFRLGRGDARGEAPCMKITLISPFPGGEGGWGMGERKQAKGKVSRRPTGQATLWAPPTPADPTTCRANLPPSTTVAGIASAAGARHPPRTTAAGIAGKQKGAPRGTCVPRGAPRAKKPGTCRITCSAFSLPA